MVRRMNNEQYWADELISYGEYGIDRYTYLATLDLRTCPKCAALDGKTFKVSEARPGVNYPPMCDSCRCTTVAYFKDNGGQRRARDPVTKKSYLVSAKMKYNAWHKNIVKKYGKDTITELTRKLIARKTKRAARTKEKDQSRQ